MMTFSFQNSGRRSIRVAALVVALGFIGVRAARADGFITPFVGFNFGGDSANCISLTNCDEKRVNWGVSFGTTHGILGFEEDIGYAPSFFGSSSGNDNAVLTVMSNLMVLIPAGPIQPYALIGLGLIRPHIQFNSSSLTLDKNALGYDIGGGVTIFPARHVGLRGDIRHLHTLQDVTLGGVFGSAKLDFLRATAGLALRF
jgi:opacity protein-like surface antigen